jgi:hypothetical protein
VYASALSATWSVKVARASVADSTVARVSSSTGTRFVDPTGGDEVVKEAGQVACAYALREVGEVQGEATGADPDLR